jgi:hypothetical protein
MRRARRAQPRRSTREVDALQRVWQFASTVEDALPCKQSRSRARQPRLTWLLVRQCLAPVSCREVSPRARIPRRHGGREIAPGTAGAQHVEDGVENTTRWVRALPCRGKGGGWCCRHSHSVSVEVAGIRRTDTAQPATLRHMGALPQHALSVPRRRPARAWQSSPQAPGGADARAGCLLLRGTWQ